MELSAVEAFGDPEEAHLIPFVRAMFALDGNHVLVDVYNSVRIVALQRIRLGFEDDMVCPEALDIHRCESIS